MSPHTQVPLAARYQLQVVEHLDTHLSAWFDDLALTRHNDTITLTGLVQDQSQLDGLLAKVRDRGLTVISKGALDETQVDEDAEEEDR